MNQAEGDVWDGRKGRWISSEEVQAQAVQVQQRPFDPHRDVSADARYIVRAILWIFVIIPVVLGLFYAIFR
jgi:hypothetical protein